MALPGLGEQGVDMVGDFDHRQVHILGQQEVDGQPAHASVGGDQAPGHAHLLQRDRLDAGQVGVTQRGGVLDKWPDRQVVLSKGLAVGIVGERIHPGGVGRAPRGLGQFLDGAQDLAGEHRAFARGHGDQGRIG